MAAKPDIWMPLYFGAYLSDTMHLTAEQHGAYLLILMAMWKRGGVLPNEDGQLAAIARLTPARWKLARAVIAPFLTVTRETVTQKRLASELAAARSRSDSASKNGCRGGRPPKAEHNQNGKLNETGIEPEQNPQKSSLPLPTPISLPSSSPQSNTASADADPWLIGKEFLAKRMAPSTVGAFIGALCRDHGKENVVTALQAAITNEPADVKSYLVGILRGKTAKFDPTTFNLKTLREATS